MLYRMFVAPRPDRASQRYCRQRVVSFVVMFCCLVPGFSWAVSPLTADESAEQWLTHMAKSVRELSYHGRSILMNGDQLNSVEIIHAVVDGQPWERVIHLTGEPAEILRRGDKISCLHPHKLATFETHSPSTTLKSFGYGDSAKHLIKYYKISKAGTGRIAGREAYRVDVMPKDRARYGYQLWLDSGSGLLLKSVTVDAKGQGLEVFEFVSIEIGQTIERSVFQPNDDVKRVTKVPTKQVNKQHDIAWQVAWLPAGFNLAEKEMRMVGGVAASTKVFSDGLAAFSVFLERVNPSTQAEGTRVHGATSALSRRLAQPDSNYLVTVVGEIPMETAMQVAMAIKLDP